MLLESSIVVRLEDIPVKKRILTLCSAVVLLFLFGSVGFAGQSDARLEKAMELCRQRQYELMEKQFIEVGVPSIPFIADHLIPADCHGCDELLLYLTLQKIDGQGAEEEVIKLLNHPNPWARAAAAVISGDRRYSSALQGLIRLLDDDTVFMTITVPGSKPIEGQVRKIANNALEKITGRSIDRGQPLATQIAQWKDWWETRDWTLPK